MKLKKKELKQLIESLMFEDSNVNWVENIKDTKYGKAAVKNMASMGVTYYAFPEQGGTPPSLYKLPDGDKYYYDKGTTGDSTSPIEAVVKNNNEQTEVYIYHPENKPAGIE